MKKILFIFLFIIFSLNNATSNEQTYYLDIDFVLNNSIFGKSIIKKLKNINLENTKKFRKKESELKEIEKEISNIKNIISENELKVKIDDLKKKISLYKSLKDEKTKNFNDLRSQEFNNFFKKITPIIEEFMKNNSIGIIIDKKNIFIANSKYDITKDIIKIINKKITNE